MSHYYQIVAIPNEMEEEDFVLPKMETSSSTEEGRNDIKEDVEDEDRGEISPKMVPVSEEQPRPQQLPNSESEDDDPNWFISTSSARKAKRTTKAQLLQGRNLALRGSRLLQRSQYGNFFLQFFFSFPKAN